MCCSQAKLALPLGGVPYAQRGSSARGFTPPIADIEWRVCHNEIHLFVDVLRLGEAVGVMFAEVVINAANGHVHGGEFPSGGVEFLPVGWTRC